MKPGLTLAMFYSVETVFTFALVFHVFYILHKARTCISRCFVYICLTVHTVLVIVNSRRFLCRASHHESTKARKHERRFETAGFLTVVVDIFTSIPTRSLTTIVNFQIFRYVSELNQTLKIRNKQYILSKQRKF